MTHYDSYKGVVAYIRLIEGRISKNEALLPMASKSRFKPVEVGIFAPQLEEVIELTAGEVGYVATGLKTVRECHVGDTLTAADNQASQPLRNG